MSDIKIYYPQGEQKNIVIEGMSSDNENNDVISEDIQQNKVFSITYQYYGTNNKQEIPDGTEVGWSTQIPNKTYLWIRTVKRYNNGTTTVSNPSPDRNSQYPIDQSSTTVPSDLSRPTPNPVITDEVDDVIGLQVEDLQNQDVSNLISEGQSDNYLQNEAFLSQTEVFNALTDNGQAQGLYRAKDENGKDQIYLNMTYARSGILQVGGSNNELGAFQVLDKDNQIIGYWDKSGIVLTEGEIKSADNSSSWNLKTGELVLNGYVMSYQVEYAVGDSKSTAPQTGWSQNAPAEVEDGKYLWQKSTLVRTGQPTRVTTVCLGKNGIDGTNGRGISSAAVEYCISSSVTDPSGDGIWSEAAPAYQENKYYWTRTRITYTDGVTEYSDPALDLALTDANRIAADASAIADVAQRAADQAKADAATAKQNAASAVADAATAKQNAASAVADAAQAKEAANQAQIDADAAAASASSAQTSASNAATSASSAQTSASNAATSASSAQASATSAAEDAAAAREDADDAQSSAEAAATSASAAQTSASNAATSASSAQSSAAAAASSAQVAQSKAEASALSAQAAQVRANDAEAAATSAAENATSALDRAREAAASADSAQTAADNAATSAGDAATSASNAQTAAGNAATSASNAAADAATANQNAAAAVEDARTAKENAVAAKTDAATAKSNAEQAQRDATAANNAATGAVTSLGIVQGVVETLETDVDDLQTHVAMMDAITDEDDNVLVPSGLHVVSTENGYFIVLSNDGMYVYDPQSVLVATYGESISFNSARPQKVGGQDAYLEYYDSNNDGKADALRIVGNKVDITGGAKIYSNNYQASSNPTSPYSASGTFLDLTNGNLYMPNFGVDNVNGQAYINGEIIATGGKLGIDGSQNYWEIDTTKTDYNSNNFASIVGHGNAFIQVGQFQLSDNLFDTRSYDAQAKITYPKYDNTYWDFGIQAPTLNTATSGYVQGIDDNFLYIRNHANTIPSLKTDWNYVFRVDDNGNIYTTGQIYIDGHSLDEIYASQGSGSAYIAKNPTGTWDNTINGNLKVTGSIDGTATKATQLTHWISINGTQWSGSSDLTLGTLNVQYGGTGATTFTAGAALIGNGTGVIQTRTITNNTSSTYVLGSTNLITANTVKYFNGAYDSAHNSNLEYVKHGKLGTVVTHAFDEFITTEGGIIDGSLQVTDLTAGNLVVTGVGRFTNGIYGDLTGNASTANKVNHDLVIQLNGGTTEGTNKFTFNGSAAKTVNVTPSAIGLGNVENTKLSTWTGSANLTTTKVGTLAAAATKGVDTSIAAASTSGNLPTSAAVAAFVEGKNYVTSSGVTSVRVQATSPVVSSVNTAQSSTLNTTISLADGYGDTKNPYASKTKNYVLAAPSDANGAPTFRALVAADIPTLASSKVGLGSVDNAKQVRAITDASRTTNNLVAWGANGYTVADSGIAKGSVATKVTLAGTDYAASSNAITITQANLQSAVQSTGLVLMTSAERSKLSSIQVSEGGTIDFSGVTASSPLTATVATDKKVNITHNTSGVTAGTYRSVTVNTYGHVTGGTNPTTLSGYGITDAKIASGVITLGSNTITPLTADSSLNAAKLTGTASVSTTGNAGTAAKFNSSRTITLTGDVTGSGSGDGSSGWSIATTVADNSHNHVPSNIIARNDNTSGGLDPITASKIGSAASNKTFGLPAEAITIEYSTDGGATWVDYGATDTQKRDLFNETRTTSFFFGKSAEKSVNNQLRVTIEPTDRYTSFHGFYCWMSTSGNTCTVDLERSTIGNKNTFTTVFSGKPLAGWSGNNIIYFNYGTFGGGSTQTGNTYKYRMTFKQTVINTSNIANSSVQDIRFIGDNVWNASTTPVFNKLFKNTLYTWDRDYNVTFPANVTATKFIGTLQGAADSATKDSSGNNIASTYLKKAGDTMTGNLLGNETATLGTTDAPFHQLVLGGSTSATMTAASTNPRITFCERKGTQPVHLIYSDYDSYRGPAGLKIIGDSDASSSPAWLEVEGTVYAPTFSGSLSGNATSATKATNDSDNNAINTTYAKLSGAAFTGAVTGTSFGASSYLAANTDSSSTAGGLTLYGTGQPTSYGIAMRTTNNGGKHGYVQSDWAIYSYMSGSTAANKLTRGWIFKNATDNVGVASISGAGNAVFTGSMTVGGNVDNTSGCRLEYNATLDCLDFKFAS